MLIHRLPRLCALSQASRETVPHRTMRALSPSASVGAERSSALISINSVGWSERACYLLSHRYKDLCASKRRGAFVQRQQCIRGVEFSYQPPPRTANLGVRKTKPRHCLSSVPALRQGGCALPSHVSPHHSTSGRRLPALHGRPLPRPPRGRPCKLIPPLPARPRRRSSAAAAGPGPAGTHPPGRRSDEGPRRRHPDVHELRLCRP